MAISRAFAFSALMVVLSTGLPHAHVSRPPDTVVLMTAEPCVLSQGYWKNHSEAWPVTALQLGNPALAAHRYSQGELLALMGTTKGDASLILAIQLIAAKLNVANGANPQPIAAVIAHADLLLGVFTGRLPYGIKTNTPVGSDMAITAGILERYNTGQVPGSCGAANTAPVANAGPDQRVLLGALVTLDGSASFDADGNPLRYEWLLLSRPPASAAVLQDVTSVRPTFVADEPGTYQLQLIVYDGFLASAPSMVRVSTENLRPIANAGADQTAPVTTTLRLDGSASSDGDGHPLSFAWRLVEQPASSQAVLQNPTTVDPSLTIDAAGDFVVELVVSDGALASLPDTVRISTVNSTPVARAGADATGVNGATITLDGSGSTDVDGDALSYRWTLLTVPSGSAAVLANDTTVAPSFVIDVSGEYVAQLIVNDGSVDSAADTVAITTLNSRPVANAGPDQAPTLGDVVQLDGAASTDVDGDALTYEWSLTTLPPGSGATLSDAASVRPAFTPDAPGLYIAQLLVRDASSASDPDTALIFVADVPSNQPPVAEAGPPQTVALGALVTLDGSQSSDPNGDPLTYRWSLSPPSGSAAVLSDATAPQPTFVADLPGNYVAQLIVNDDSADSAPDTVTVSTLNSTPVANAGPDQAVATGSTVTLDGSASFDPDGTPLSYTWSLTRPDGSAAELSSTSTADPSFVADVDGVYVAQLIVSDGTLASAPDTVAITAGPGADLDVTFFRAPTSPGVNIPDDWGITLLNFGPQFPVDAEISMPVPSGYTFVEAGPSQGTYNPVTGIWSIDGLNGIAGLRLRLQPLAAGDHDITASVHASTAPDPNPGNNRVTVAVTPNPNVDLGLTFFNSSPGTRTPGEEIFIVADLRNAGPAAADNTAVEFRIPEGFTLVDAATQAGSFDSTTGLWTIGRLEPFVLARTIFRLRLNPLGPIDLRLVATTTSPDSNPADNVVEIPRYNRIPIANAGADAAASTQGLVTLDGSASFDPDGDPITFEWTSAVRPINSNGAIADPATPAPSFTPDLPGNYVARLIVRDNRGEPSAPDTVTVAAAVTNTAPAFASTPVTSAFTEQPYQYDVNATDVDTADALQYSLPTAPEGMTIDPQTGMIEWLPAASQGGAAAVVVRVQDGAGFEATQSFTIQVSSPSNGAPVAVDDAYTVRLGESLSVAAPGVTANDADASPLSAGLASQPGNGTVLFNSDGSFTYTPHTMQPGEFVLAENINLVSRLPGVVLSGGDCPHCAADENIETEWDSRGATLVVTFPSDVRVSRVDVVGVRRNKPKITAARLVLESPAGVTLFDSGNVELPGPDHDGRFVIPGVPGVRRVRFIPDPTSNFFAALAEIKVIGSGLMQRTPFVEPNLVQLLPVTVQANTAFGPHVPEGLVDDSPSTNWYTAATPGDFVEVTFPLPVTVRELVAANPNGRPDGFGTSDPLACSGTFTLLDANRAVLFDSGIVNEPSGSHAAVDTFTLAIPDIAGVRHLRYTLSSCTQGYGLGFADWRVLGSAAVSTLALSMSEKLQSLQGREAHSTPIVINLTDDNGDGLIDVNDVPDIAVPVEASTDDQVRGEIMVISGDDGRLLFTAGGPNLVSPWSELAAGDIDGDGLPEILAVSASGDRLLAFEHDGTPKWQSAANTMPSFLIGEIRVFSGAISIANLDGAGAPEIIVGASVFDAGGQLLGDGRTLGGTTGGTGLRSAISTVGDIDLDGTPELVAGPTAYRLTAGLLTTLWQRTDRADGYTATANLDDDPQAEIVSVANGVVYALNHDGSDFQPWNAPTHDPVAIPGGGQGGAPLVVDVDGDGRPEIGVAGASNFVLFNRDGQVRWKAAISDRTSNSTGAVAFDLNGDGEVEIIYRDERFLRIYRGADGVLLLKTLVGSATWSEEPVVADVDNDGHADIVVSSDLFGQSNNDTGLLVFQDVANRWTRTRRIWNQHAYHVTNVAENGAIPVTESAHWLASSLNAFRTNAFVAGESADATDSFTYVASDGSLESNPATVRIALRAPNAAPHFTSQPIASAAPEVVYSYAAQADDADGGDILTFSLASGPAGMAIDPQSGLIEWTPEAGQLGSHQVVVKVADLRGLFALQSYSIEVAAALTVPAIEGQPAAAADALIAGAGLTVGEVTSRHSALVALDAVISQHPAAGTPAAAGSPVNYVVSLGAPPAGIVPAVIGLTQADATFEVAAAGFSAAITIQSSSIIPAGRVLAQDPAAGTAAPAGSAVALVVSTGPPPGEIDLDGDGFTGDQGDCRDDDPLIHPNAFDVPGDGIDQNCNGVDSIAGDDTAPTASLVSPDDLAEITMPTDIIGTVADANFLRYTVQLAGVDATTFIVIGSGTAPVTAGTVGRLDPTLLENGLYRVRLIAEDVNGQMTTDERVYRIDGMAKAGNFRLTFTDLSVPVAGIPITITRTYDSRVTTQEDFGIGWTLDVRRGTYRHNRTPGLGWIIRDQPFLGEFLPCIGGTLETRSHLTEVRLSESESYRFALEVRNGTLGITGACEGVASFRFVDGTRPGATLEILDGNGVIYLRGGGDVVLDMNAFLDGLERPFDPQQVRLTTMDGAQIELERGAGITRIADLNGNALSIGPGGIVHSSGRSIRFERDSADRIVRILDPAGRALTYGYDGAGDLTLFTDRGGTATQFEYDTMHRLVRIIDPSGHSSVASEYDAAGRVIRIVDVNGHAIQLSHDVAARSHTETDQLGHTTTRVYDDRGNIISERNARGGVTTRTFDARDNLLTETDPLGHTKTYSYDESGNRLTQADPLGNEHRYTYDAQGRLTLISDPEGHTTTYSYDASGNVSSQTDAAGSTTTYGYARGLARRIVDAAGNVTTIAYDDFGRKTRVVDPLGAERQFAYDANGNVTLETRPVRTPAGVVPHVTAYTYDANGNVISVRDATGALTSFEYDAGGQATGRTDPLGRRIEATYKGMQLAEVRSPDGLTISRQFDAAGRMIGFADRSGRRTGLTLDATGNPTALTYPDDTPADDADNPRLLTEVDLAGRLTAMVSESGHRTTLDLDAAGRIVGLVEPGGDRTAVEYDRAGRQVARSNALGEATRYERDAVGNVTRLIEPDGSAVRFEYDVLGRPVTRIDQLSRVWTYGYDPAGRLVRVTNPAGGQSRYTYDDAGNLVRYEDAQGRQTRFEYDSLGRRVATVRPLGQRSEAVHDASGQLVRARSMTGSEMRFDYDALGRLARKTFPGGAHADFTYTATGRRASAVDDRGTTRWEYDSRDRLAARVEPDGTRLDYAWNDDGTIRSIAAPFGTQHYAYDAKRRLASVTDPEGLLTTYAYDGADRMVRTERPDGTVEEREYDARGRVVKVTNSHTINGAISSHAYTYDAVGNITLVQEGGGRSVQYQYDVLDRVTREVISDSGPGSRTIEYDYDAVGNVLELRDSIDGTTVFSYDDNDRLQASRRGTAITTFAYDGAGNLVSANQSAANGISYGWDAEDRLVAMTVRRAGTTQQFGFGYDVDGIRVRRVVDGTETRFLVDHTRPVPQVLAEYGTAGDPLAVYAVGLSRISQNRSGAKSFYAYDGHSGVRALTDAGGSVTDRYAYDAFGKPLDIAGTTVNEFLYRGEQFERSVNLAYLRARYYDVTSARFLATDPEDGAVGDPISHHRYAYARNNPLMYQDPTGRTSLAETSTASSIYGTLAKLAFVGGALSMMQNIIVPFVSDRFIDWEGTMGTLTIDLKGFAHKGPVGASYGGGGALIHANAQNCVGNQRMEGRWAFVALFGVSAGFHPNFITGVGGKPIPFDFGVGSYHGRSPGVKPSSLLGRGSFVGGAIMLGAGFNPANIGVGVEGIAIQAGWSQGWHVGESWGVGSTLSGDFMGGYSFSNVWKDPIECQPTPSP